MSTHHKPNRSLKSPPKTYAILQGTKYNAGRKQQVYKMPATAKLGVSAEVLPLSTLDTVPEEKREPREPYQENTWKT